MRRAGRFICITTGRALTYVRGQTPVASGRHRLTVVYEHDGGFGAGGLAHLLVNGEEFLAENQCTVPVIFSMSGETFDIGRDTGAPVGPYEHQFPFSGDIESVTLERLNQPDNATAKLERQGRFKASLSSQ